MERITLSSHFTYKKLFRFVTPSIIMMVFVSVYGIVDGFFVSNFVGKIEFAALNLIFPLIMILGSVGFMLGTGGNAVVSKALGEGNKEKANRIFSMLVYTAIVLGVLLSVTGILIAKPVARLFAATEKTMSATEKELLIEYCTLYARTLLVALPAFMLQNAFQGFFVTAEKPRLGLYVTVFAGVGNILFDTLFIVVFKWGLVGAAVATALNQLLGGVIPLFYFGRNNDSLLRLGKTSFDGKTLGKVCVNGLSELITNISLSLVGIIYNVQLMSIVGIVGVSAYGVMQYIGFIFIAVFLGYAVGVAPIIGYHFGAKNHDELKNVLRKSLCVMSTLGAVMTVVGLTFATPFAMIFVYGDKPLLQMTVHGLRINALCFVFCGLNIFTSAFFTALGSGGLSLLVSFSRTFFCQVVSVLILPIFFAINGVWFSLVVAEAVTLVLSVLLLVTQRKRFHYGEIE